MQKIHLRLAIAYYVCFLGYGLDDAIPNHNPKQGKDTMGPERVRVAL